MAIIISQNGKNAVRVEKSAFEKEDHIQRYIYDNPESIPLYEIKEDIRLLVLARELPSNAGPIDGFGVDGDGELYIIETKLFKNPDRRTVIAQALDYGAALWAHTRDFSEFSIVLDSAVHKKFGVSLTDKFRDFFGIEEAEITTLLDQMRNNLDDGKFHFVVPMDHIEDRLRDLILYINQNSQFDIYAVEFEYYKHEQQEIIIPRIFGTEVKKDLKTSKNSGKLWNWDLFKQRLQEFGDEEVTAAEQIIEWVKKNSDTVEISWTSSQRGGFFICFYAQSDSKKGLYPFVVTGDAKIVWNTPRQKNHSPYPFDKPEKRVEILKRLKSIKGAVVDLDNVDGFNGFKLPLRALANDDARNEFFAVCAWIKKSLHE